MTQAPLRALLLDLDGTLIETEHDFLLGELSRILTPLGYAPPDQQKLLEAHSRGALWEWLPADNRAEIIKQFWQDYRGHAYPHPRPLPGVIETLKKLRSLDLKLMVVTFRSDSNERVSELLAECGLLPYLDGVYSMGKLAPVAPDKSSIITQALNDFAIHPHEAAIVGDAKPDIVSGRVCNLRYAIAVETGGFDYDYLASLKPDYILSHISELPGLLHAISIDPVAPSTTSEPS